MIKRHAVYISAMFLIKSRPFFWKVGQPGDRTSGIYWRVDAAFLSTALDGGFSTAAVDFTGTDEGGVCGASHVSPPLSPSPSQNDDDPQDRTPGRCRKARTRLRQSPSGFSITLLRRFRVMARPVGKGLRHRSLARRGLDGRKRICRRQRIPGRRDR